MTKNRTPSWRNSANGRANGERTDAEVARSEAGEETAALPQGWSRPKPEVIPHPTYWPVIFSAGVALAMWGIISNIFIFSFGVIFFVVGLGGWIWDMLHE